MFYYRHIRKNCAHPGKHFHEDWAIYVTLRVKTAPLPGGHENCAPPGGHVFQPSKILLNSAEKTLRANVMIKFHEDWTINVTSRVLTSLHEDQTKNVASRVLTRQHVDDPRRTTNDGQKVIPKAHHEHVALR
ncbi:hypothetical protein DPMN_183590 [Dreissena polymorpha]|uniref:Uncharacterized protein n=1 Tax=Dreissena polymorpha TaxID=45954 RepID=A0A9D4DGW5_DREPO|nr:hypothetical protein DPMN_183590 [Dreissena polymorpha]